MISIRQGVFETNSSSQHCVTVKPGMRDVDEFPMIEDYDIHIPFGNPSVTDTFLKLVQYIICMMLEEHPLEHLMNIPTEDRKKFYKVIQLAYKMAGIGEVDNVIIDPANPKRAGGINIDADGDVTLFGCENTELGTLGIGLQDALDELAGAVKNNNTALSLVTWYAKDVDPTVAYAAAALALNTSGYFIEM